MPISGSVQYHAVRATVVSEPGEWRERVHFDSSIRAQSPEEELSELAIQSLEGYFRSHPQPSERLAQANRLIAQEGWQDRKTEKPFRVEYETRSGKYVK